MKVTVVGSGFVGQTTAMQSSVPYIQMYQAGLNPEGRPVGILSARRVVHYLVEHFPALVFNLPPEPDRFPAEPEGP